MSFSFRPTFVTVGKHPEHRLRRSRADAEQSRHPDGDVLSELQEVGPDLLLQATWPTVVWLVGEDLVAGIGGDGEAVRDSEVRVVPPGDGVEVQTFAAEAVSQGLPSIRMGVLKRIDVLHLRPPRVLAAQLRFVPMLLRTADCGA